MEPCQHLGWSSQALILSILALGAMPKQQQQQQQRELRSSIQQAFTWSRRWDFLLNAGKSHHLSIGGSPDLCIARKRPKVNRCRNMSKSVPWALLWTQRSPPQLISWLLQILHKKIIYMPDEWDLHTSIQCFRATTSRICHPSKLFILQKGHKPPRKTTKGRNKVGEGS